MKKIGYFLFASVFTFACFISYSYQFNTNARTAHPKTEHAETTPTISIRRERTEYEKTGKVVWEANTETKKVALTFDDGPNPAYTPQILETLKRYDARATFFVLGAHVKKFPALVAQQAKEGHEIGNHT